MYNFFNIENEYYHLDEDDEYLDDSFDDENEDDYEEYEDYYDNDDFQPFEKFSPKPDRIPSSMKRTKQDEYKSKRKEKDAQRKELMDNYESGIPYI